MGRKWMINSSPVQLHILSDPCATTSSIVKSVSPYEYYSVDSLYLVGKRQLWYKESSTGGWLHVVPSHAQAFSPVLDVFRRSSSDDFDEMDHGMDFADELEYFITKKDLDVHKNRETVIGTLPAHSVVAVDDFKMDESNRRWASITLVDTNIVRRASSASQTSFVAGWVECAADGSCLLEKIKEPCTTETLFYQNVKPTGTLPVRDAPSLSAHKVDSIDRFAVVECRERRLVEGQMWLRVAGLQERWVIETNAVSGQMMLRECLGPSMQDMYYRNVYQKKALPVRSSPWLSAPTTGKLPVGHVFKSSERRLNDLGQLWVNVDSGWVIERNGKTNAQILARVEPPGQCTADTNVYYQVSAPSKSLLCVLPQPDLTFSNNAVFQLHYGQVFRSNARKLTQDGSMWISVVDDEQNLKGWIPESLDGVSVTARVVPAPDRRREEGSTARNRTGSQIISRLPSVVVERHHPTPRVLSFQDRDTIDEDQGHSSEPPPPPPKHESPRVRSVQAAYATDDLVVQIDPASGVYSEDVRVIVSCTDHHQQQQQQQHVTIYYTIDGSEPDIESLVYDAHAGILLTCDARYTLSRGIVVKAIAVRNDNRKSLVAECSYRIQRVDCAGVCAWLTNLVRQCVWTALHFLPFTAQYDALQQGEELDSPQTWA